MHPYLEEDAQNYIIGKMNEFAAKKVKSAA
jgi:hypothetical protein